MPCTLLAHIGVTVVLGNCLGSLGVDIVVVDVVVGMVVDSLEVGVSFEVDNVNFDVVFGIVVEVVVHISNDVWGWRGV